MYNMRLPMQFLRAFKKETAIFHSISPTIAVDSSLCTAKTCCTSRLTSAHRKNVGILSSSKQHNLAKLLWRSICSGGTSKCWNCALDQEGFTVFCKKCNIIQRPDTKLSYFRIFGIQETYEIELSDLASKYRKLQNVLHPDRFTNREDEEKRLSEDFSSLVNKAYFTLLNPLKRGLYMLEQKGVYVEDGKSSIQSSPEFLMEIMERNEDIDDAKSKEQLEILNLQNKASFDKLIRELAEAFKMQNIKLAEETVTKMKYYASIDLKIKELKRKEF